MLTQYIVDVNHKLSRFQQERIKQTPFKWMLEMDKVLDISNSLMRELLSRWAADKEAFRIRKSIVPFSTLDVCFALGLPVVGEEVKMENDGGGVVNTLFEEGEEMNLSTILKKLEDKNLNKNVDDFVRLYILLGLYVFYVPRTSRTFTSFASFAFKCLDNLDALQLYNWGGALYNVLVTSLMRASQVYYEDKNVSEIYLAGCVAVLQVS